MIIKLPDADAILVKKRAETSVTKAEFCKTLKVAGILPRTEAVEAVKGNWPNTFAEALSSLSDDAQFDAEVEWSSAKVVQRAHPLIAMIAGTLNMTDEQVDVLFGV
jgi:hypothetical protein